MSDGWGRANPYGWVGKNANTRSLTCQENEPNHTPIWQTMNRIFPVSVRTTISE